LLRSLSARGSVVANSDKANSRGVKFESSKLMSEKRVPFEITSGTPSIVVLVRSQVTCDAIPGRKDSTSALRATFPITKQNWDARRSRGTRRCQSQNFRT